MASSVCYHGLMSETFSFSYFGSTIIARSLGLQFTPPLDQTITAHCIPVTDDGMVVAADVTKRGVDVPGGHIDNGESAEEAMRRETHEETFVTVEKPVLIDVWKLSSDDERIGLAAKPYLLLYAAKVKSIEDFVANDEVSSRLILTPSEFISEYFGDKKQAAKMVAQAIAALR